MDCGPQLPQALVVALACGQAMAIMKGIQQVMLIVVLCPACGPELCLPFNMLAMPNNSA